ncbi:MAG: DNA primase [Nitrospiraceae bacterium]|nr:MAG: DNA primase [Nitrospiraceae bacterium]
MPSRDGTLDEIKSRLDIVDFISGYVQLKKAGQNWKGLCPFHAEKTPSFTVSPAKQIYHCFGCGSGGDIFSFLARYENLTFPEALKVLAGKAGVQLKPSRQDRGEKDLLYGIHNDALTFFTGNLTRSSKAVEYLRGRGISDKDQSRFSIGYAPKSWNALLTFLTRKGYRPEMIRQAGLASQGSRGMYDTFRDRIMFPIHDLKNDVIAFGGRSIDGSEPKYLNSPETPIFSKGSVLYGMHAAKDALKKEGYALFMEGYMDVITAHIHGLTHAVAALGTALTQSHGKLIRRFVENVILVFDSDEAGVRAAKNAAAILLESGLAVKVISFPDKEDPDSFLRSRGRDAFEALLERPLSVVQFLMQRKGDSRMLAREVLDIISRAPDRILQGTYIKELAETLSVNERYVREELQRVTRNAPGRGQQPASETRRKSRPSDLELFVIQLIIQTPEKSDEIFPAFSPEDFQDGTVRSIFEKLRNESGDFDDVLEQCTQEEKDVLTRISLRDAFEDPAKVLRDCIRKAALGRRDRLVRDVEKKIKEAEIKKDPGLLNELLRERQRLMMSVKQ